MQTEAQPTRTRILNAAREIFSENGFHSASMKAICKSCAISPGTLYHHFISKEALIQAIILQDQERALARFREPIEGIHFVDYMVESIVSLTHEAFGQRALVVEIMAEGMRNPQVAAMLKNKHMTITEFVAQRMRDAQQKGEISPDINTAMTSRLLLDLTYGVLADLGDIANNFAFAMGALFLLSYYTDVAGVGAAAAGTMLLLVRVFDAFADVFAGRVVDSVNTRWGKFRPFLLFGTAPLMIFSVLVFWVPTDWSHGSKVVYAYLTYMGLGLCYSLVNIPYGSLATAMTQQPQSRARLGAARGIAASLTFVCLAFLIGPSIKNSSPEEMVSVYHFWTIVLAIAGMVLYFICFKSTRENVVRIVAQPSLKISLQTLKRNRPLFMLCIGALCVLISTFAVSASSLFYVRYVLNDTGLFTVLVLVQNLVGTVASAPLVPGMVARIGKKNTFLIGALLGTCGYLLFFWVSVWSLPVALVALAIASIGQGVTMTVMWALEADTVEYGEYLTGVRIEGLTYSLFSFTRKCGQAIGGSIPAFILGLSGYIANQVQTPEVIMGIRTSIALVPCGFMLLAFVIIWFYPLTDKKFKEIVVEIDNRKKVQQQLISDITN